MTTAQESRSRVTDPPEQWALLRGIRWETYEAILDEMENRHVFLTYDHGVLEIMSPSFRHEIYGRLIAELITILADVLDLPIKGGKSTTFRKQELDRGLEPDECFWIANEPRLRGRFDHDPETDPPPDLAIEIEISRRSLDRLSIYSELGVPEIWRCDGGSLTFHRRQPDGTYDVVPRSPSLPMRPPEESLRFLGLYETMSETAWRRAFRDWARAEVLPRRGDQARGGAPPP